MAKITWDDRTNSGADSEVSASIFNDTKTSVNTLYDVIEARLGTTSSSSNIELSISGGMEVSGSILPATNKISSLSSFDLGSPTAAWNEIYVSNGSLNFVDDAGITSFTKQELDDIQSGKSATTGSKGGVTSGSWSTTKAIFSEDDDSTLIRFGDNRMYLSTQGGLMIDITGSNITYGVSGSTNTHTMYGGITVYGNTPAVVSIGDVAVGSPNDTTSAGIFTFGQIVNGQTSALGAGQTYVYNYDNQITSFLNIGYSSIISGSFGVAQGSETRAGWYSHAEGYQTEAGIKPYNIATVNPITQNLWQWSHAEGYQSKAETTYSHAEGLNTLTTGTLGGAAADGAHAEGKETISRGEAAHAEGYQTIAYAPQSHTEGYLSETWQSAAWAHAEGIGTIASGSGQHVQGKYNTRGNTTSLMVIGNGVSDGARSDLALFNTDGIEFTADFTASLISASGQLFAGIPEDTDESGTNVVVFNPSTGEFEYTGSFNGEGGSDDDWHITTDDLNVTSSRNVLITGSVDITGSLKQGILVDAAGEASHAQGFQTSAGGNYSHAEGKSSKASGNHSHAEGYFTTTIGDNSHTEGYYTTTSANYSHAEGYGTLAKGQGSHVEGYYAIASGSYSHAEGRSTVSIGLSSHAEGKFTTASNSAAHSEGSNTHAEGIASHAEGISTYAQGDYAHAEGAHTIASGQGSHAEGSGSKATGEYSHAEGFESVASGDFAYVRGYRVSASGDYSYAIGGLSNNALGNYSIVEGDYNLASGSYTHTRGTYTTASGQHSFAEGLRSKTHISASYARAEGQDTHAIGIGAHAAGSGSVAGFYGPEVGPTPETHSGNYSYAGGLGTVATEDYIHAVGMYNTTGSTSGAFVIGNGTSDSDRKNLAYFAIDGILLDTGSLPTSDPQNVGQLYRTSSAHFGVQGDLQVLLISQG